MAKNFLLIKVLLLIKLLNAHFTDDWTFAKITVLTSEINYSETNKLYQNVRTKNQFECFKLCFKSNECEFLEYNENNCSFYDSLAKNNKTLNGNFWYKVAYNCFGEKIDAKNKILNSFNPTVINLNFQNICYIKPFILRNFTFLIYLLIRNNILSFLQANTFIGMDNLACLDLSNNKIDTIKSGAFNGLSKLIFLGLQSNRLKYLSTKSLSGLTLLRSLDLSNNMIEYLEKNTFDDLISLRYLTLSSNRFNYLDAEIFLKIPELIHLNLGVNNLKSMDLKFLKKLDDLYLNNNQLTNFTTNLTSIKYLYLNGNPLGYLNYSFFESNGMIPSLNFLNIHNCQLESIDKNAFIKYKNLANLIIGKNNFKTLDYKIFDEMNTTLRSVSVDRNASYITNITLLYPWIRFNLMA
ncbi:unnamed protein product [Brachionus calyciflorus]|uniref:Uncharacterized protein n=1 Tax=Brachionus calyciflorus TaxID=104777 RepID=A0A814ND19_9BILA|nr:unnamed protein product [Brachionus calyciflorus]